MKLHSMQQTSRAGFIYIALSRGNLQKVKKWFFWN